MADAAFQFLPFDRMAAVAAGRRAGYQTAKPFPHVVIDDFFDPALLSRIVEEFPGPHDILWTEYKNDHEIKLASSRDEDFGPLTRSLLYHLNSAPFLDFLSELTQIPELIADSYFSGGGMHLIEPGGKLDIHADFNRHPGNKLDRRLNLLLYLNKGWQDEFCGHLELWDRTMAQCVQRIAPVFNRMVVFSTTDFAFHGHPVTLRCPPGMTRRSLALYYYTNGRPKDEVGGVHSTLFRARPGDGAPA